MQNKTSASLSASSSGSAPVQGPPHNLIVENRRTVTATGVTRVLSYDENSASLETQQGGLIIGGQGIQVSELSIQTGELKIYGQIEYLQYSDPKPGAGGFFRRLGR